MTMITTTFEVNRPPNWRGEVLGLCQCISLEPFEMTVEADVSVTTDHYGADRDGNRGVSVDDVDICDYTVTVELENGKLVTCDEEIFFPAEMSKLEDQLVVAARESGNFTEF